MYLLHYFTQILVALDIRSSNKITQCVQQSTTSINTTFFSHILYLLKRMAFTDVRCDIAFSRYVTAHLLENLLGSSIEKGNSSARLTAMDFSKSNKQVKEG